MGRKHSVILGGSNIRSLLFDSWGSDAAKKRKKISQNSKVYFIRQGLTGPVKIGVSSRPGKRLITLQTANPEPLFLLGIIKGDTTVEAVLHERFKKYLRRGEWYHSAPEFIKEIKEILERGCL